MNFLGGLKGDIFMHSAIIGLGVGLEHVEGYLNSGSCQVKYLVDSDKQARNRAQDRYPEIQVIENLDIVFSDPDIDIVSIATYDNSHFDLIMRGIDTGKHLFVEKPFCLSYQELKTIWSKLKLNPHLKISSNYILRKSPRFIQLKEDVRLGKFGKIFHFEGDYDYGRLQKITEGWRGSIDYYSVMHGGGLHLIDLLCWITDQRPESVCGLSNNICAKGTKFKQADFSVGLLQFPDGMIGKISANFGCVRPHFHRVSLYGTKATFYNDPQDGKLYTSREYGPPQAYSTPYYGYQKGDLIPSFIQEIRGEGKSIVTKNDVFNSMAISFAIESACLSGTFEKVQYLTGEL